MINWELKIRNWKFVLLLFAICFLLFVALPVQAQVDNQLANLLVNTPLINVPLIKIIFDGIRYLLGFLGVVAVVILIYGGFLWMTARGNEEQVKKAKKTLINGLIGLIIILLSFAIIQFVVGPLLRGGGDGISQPPGPPGGYPNGANYLVVTSKYPQPAATVAKNNKIIITFNQNLKEDSVNLARPKPGQPTQTDCTDFTVSIKRGDNFLDGSLKVRGNALIFVPETACPPPLDAKRCTGSNPQNCSLTLTPDGCCGCFPAGEITIYLKSGRDGLKGSRQKGNELARDVSWNFTAADYLEMNPPEVENNLPQGDNIPRNLGIVVTFTKEIDLSTLKIYNRPCKIGSPDCDVPKCGQDSCLGYAVDDPNEATIKITSGDSPIPIPGFFERLTTKSFLFRPSEYCPAPAQGCRCLPANAQISVKLTDEIKDVNCNSLNCANGKCSWHFTTSQTIDLDPPNVFSTLPTNNAVDVNRLTDLQAIFTDPSGTPMDPTSVNEDTFVLRPEMTARDILTNNFTSTYKPSRILDANTRYASVLFGGGSPAGSCQLEPDQVWGVKDLAGNAMVDNYLWNFTTSWQVGTGDPRITRVSPSQGPYGQCVTIGGFNLGCCLTNPCPTTNNTPAKNNKWTGTTCQQATNSGLVGFFKEWEGTNPVYLTAEILSWKEINQPESCEVGRCPGNCSALTCDPTDCSSCDFFPNPQSPCQCPMPPGYSPENEIIVRVPSGAANRSPSQPGQIKVTPAH